jgi:hypothetical protein
LEYQEEAEYAFGVILQKKLFNMQLQWRANQLKIEDVEVSSDFTYWEQNIFGCPFIPLVSRHEVELMKEFLFQLDEPGNGNRFDFHEWQDYNLFLEKDENGNTSDMPEWYQFYDNRIGTGMLLLLPDIRGTMEEKYLELAREYNKKHAPQSKTPQAPPDTRPSLAPFGQPLVDFSRVVETDKHIKELFDYLEFDIQSKEKLPDEYELESSLDILKAADRPIHFESKKE